MISDEDIQKVSAATDFVSLVAETVPVKQKGHDFWCCCPFHSEKTPSCKIDPAENLWHCFGCGEGGSIFTYVMKLHDVSFREAVHMLADRAHIDIVDTSTGGIQKTEKNRLQKCCELACDFYAQQLLRGKGKQNAKTREYLSKRHFNIEVARRWSLGFAPGGEFLVKHLKDNGFSDEEIEKCNLGVKRSGKMSDRFFNRVMFPIFDGKGECVAFGGRVIGDGNPKYLNSSETPLFHKSKILYGLDKAKNEIVSSGYAVVVEGYTDVISCHESGIKNVVATLGTSLTLQHIKLLSRYASKKIVYLFDGDEAGQRAAERALQFIDYQMTPEAGHSRCDLHAATIPDLMDPAEFIEKEGSQALRDVLENSVSLIEFGIKRKISKHDLSTPEGRSRALVDAISVLGPIKNSILAKDYATLIASMTRASVTDALTQLDKLKVNKKIEVTPTNAITDESCERKNDLSQEIKEKEQVLDTREKNRLNNEAQLVALAVQNPVFAISEGDSLLNIEWHDKLNKVIIEKALLILTDNLQTKSTALINKILQDNPKARGVLTSVINTDKDDVKRNFYVVLNNVLLDDLKDKQDNLNLVLAGEFDKKKRAELLDEVSDLAIKKAKLISNLAKESV